MVTCFQVLNRVTVDVLHLSDYFGEGLNSSTFILQLGPLTRFTVCACAHWKFCQFFGDGLKSSTFILQCGPLTRFTVCVCSWDELWQIS